MSNSYDLESPYLGPDVWGEALNLNETPDKGVSHEWVCRKLIDLRNEIIMLNDDIKQIREAMNLMADQIGKLIFKTL